MPRAVARRNAAGRRTARWGEHPSQGPFALWRAKSRRTAKSAAGTGCAYHTLSGDLEAGTGIEPVFTDLQSNPFLHKNNPLSKKRFQDKAETHGEHETLSDCYLKNENPGALAGATGADQLGTSFKSEHYRNRAKSATALCDAIAQCEREDAILILSAALVDLSRGGPLPVWLNTLDDARWWASFATEIELKAYALAAFEALRPKARIAFLSHVQGRAAV